MPTNSKPRKKYRPKLNLKDPVGYLIEGLQSIRSKGRILLELQVKNSSAMTSLMRGGATRRELGVLIEMSNVAEALQVGGFGAQYKEVAIQGRMALIAITDRATRVGKLVPAGPDIAALNDLMELHDAQMDVITVKDLQRAIAYATDQIARGKATRLPGAVTTGEQT